MTRKKEYRTKSGRKVLKSYFVYQSIVILTCSVLLLIEGEVLYGLALAACVVGMLIYWRVARY